MIERNNESIYCRSGRFQTMAFEEPFHEVTDAVINILKWGNKDYFENKGKITGVLGLKLYGQDLRIKKLCELCLIEDFKWLRSREQMRQIEALICSDDFNQPSSAWNNMIMQTNAHAESFLNALQSKDVTALKALKQKLQGDNVEKADLQSQENTIGNAYFNMLIKTSKLVKPEDRVFQKQQCLQVAHWWLHTLQNKIPHITDQIKAYEVKSKPPKIKRTLQLTEQQKRTFVTTLADLVWK
jgi:hypothetical protein